MAKAEKKPAKKSSSKVNDLSVNTENGAAQFLTTNQGLKINDNNNSLKAGERGAILLEDFIMSEKLLTLTMNVFRNGLYMLEEMEVF